MVPPGLSIATVHGPPPFTRGVRGSVLRLAGLVPRGLASHTPTSLGRVYPGGTKYGAVDVDGFLDLDL